MQDAIIQAVLIAAIIVLYTLQSLFSKMYTDNYPGKADHAPEVFAIICAIVVPLISLGFAGFSFGPFRWETLVFGLANAVILYGYDQFIIKASTKGPYSIMMVFSLGGGIIIPALFKLLPFEPFGGSFSITQFVAIAIICTAVYMVSVKKEESEENGTKDLKVFFVLSILLAICNGLYGVMFVVQEGITGVEDKPLFIIYSFLGAGIISAVRLIIGAKKDTPRAFVQSKKSLIFLILAALVSAVAVNVLSILLTVVDETVLYTFDNAGVMLLSALASALIFKDKLSKLNIVGCIIMTLALVMMGASKTIDVWLFG